MRLFQWSASILAVLIATSAGAKNLGRKIDLSVLSASVQADVLKQLPALKGENFTLADLDALIRFLVTEEQFDSVQVQVQDPGADTSFFITVGKTRRIISLAFSGNKNISESDIRAAFAINEKEVFDQQGLIDAGDRVRRLYLEQGFQNTVVDLEFSRYSATDIGVAVKIKEGPQTLIRNVDLRASNPEFKDRFEKYLRKKLLGEPLTEQNLNAVRKNLREEFSSRHYFQADLQEPQTKLNADESQASLTFSVPNSDEYIIDYQGLKGEMRGTIEKTLDLDHFYSANPNIAPEIATRVKNYYLGRGYARAEVTSKDIDGTHAHQRRLILEINEGPRVKIKEIHFSGRYSETEKYYESFLKKHSSDLIADNYYNRDGIETGVKNLIIDRQNQGFLKAKIVSIKTSYQGPDKSEVALNINFDEGPLTLLESVSFEGNSSFSSEELNKVLGLRPQEPLKLNQLDESVVKIKEFYRNSGYLEMSLLNEKEDLIQYSDDASRAQVKFKIFEGPKVIVGSILIEGNTLTRDYVIMKELEFKVGDTLTPQRIEESTNRLQRLGHFLSVDIKTLEEKTQISRRTVIVKVPDRNPGLFNLGAGATNERNLTLRGYTGIAYRNIMGTGRGASLRLEGNYNVSQIHYLEYNVTFGYLEPYLFDTRAKGRFSYSNSEFISPTDSSRGNQVKQYAFTVEEDITSHILLSFDIYNSAQYYDFPIDKSNNTIGRDELVINTVGPTVDIDFRDHPFNPTTGTFTRLSAEYAPRSINERKIQYIRAFASFTHYKSIWGPNWVWANSVRGGYLRNLSPESDGGVPYDKKGLILGGESTIRGFTPDEAFPNIIDLGMDPAEFRLKTHANMYLLKSELRFPISGAFGGAVFYDGGAVTIESSGPSDTVDIKDPYRDAVGLAFRYATPVGAVSLEVGYKLDRHDDRHESQFPIYFSIGTF